MVGMRSVVCCTLSLPRSSGQVLGAVLNSSEMQLGAADHHTPALRAE
jgi:hypothetical protein